MTFQKSNDRLSKECTCRTFATGVRKEGMVEKGDDGL